MVTYYLCRPSETLRAFGSDHIMPHNPANKAKMDSEYTALMAELGEGPQTGSRGYGNSRFGGGPLPMHSHGGVSIALVFCFIGKLLLYVNLNVACNV